MRKLIVLFYILLLAKTGFAGSARVQDWQEAIEAYNKKDYMTAATIYENMLRTNPYIATACFNLGNTYYRMNRIPEAVLQYERAAFLQMEPGKIQDNVSLAQQRIPNAIRSTPDIFFVRWWSAATTGSKANAWALGAFIVLVGLLALIWINKFRPGKIPPQLVGGIAFLWCCMMIPAYFSAEHARQSDLAVVMNNGAVLSQEPGSVKGNSPVPEATVVKTGERKGNWIAVSLPNNRSGWIPVADLGFVQPK